MAEWFTGVEAEWQDAVLRWRTKVAEFQSALEIHWANRDKAIALGPEEFARWQAQLDYALRVKTAVEMLQESLAASSSWARSTLGLGMLRSMMGELGALPLIPVAIIVGSISTVTSVIYALYSYNGELERKWGYINAHPELSPAQVNDLLESESPIPLAGTVKSMALMVVVGGLLLFFGPGLLARVRK